jgi:hypothetical protein
VNAITDPVTGFFGPVDGSELKSVDDAQGVVEDGHTPDTQHLKHARRTTRLPLSLWLRRWRAQVPDVLTLLEVTWSVFADLFGTFHRLAQMRR